MLRLWGDKGDTATNVWVRLPRRDQRLIVHTKIATTVVVFSRSKSYRARRLTCSTANMNITRSIGFRERAL